MFCSISFTRHYPKLIIIQTRELKRDRKAKKLIWLKIHWEKNFFWATAGQALDLLDSEDRPPKLKLQAQSKVKVENQCMTGGLFQTDFIPHNDKSIADYMDELILI